jgi:hypothetical protein
LSSVPQGPASGGTFIVFIAILILLIIRRVYRSYSGVRYSEGRTIGYAVFYVAFGSFFSILSFFEGVPLVFAIPYAAILAAAALWSYRLTDRRISFWQGVDGIYFKGGVILYVIYLIGLMARLSIEVIAFGPSLLAPTSTGLLSAEALDATLAADLLMMFGLGLLVGRNARVIARYRRIERGEEHLPGSPPAYQPIFGSRKPEAGPSA